MSFRVLLLRNQLVLLHFQDLLLELETLSILAGTVIKTPTNAAGSSERFEVESDVTLTGLSINASVRALIAGVSGNVQANKVTQVETALTDPSIVVNNASAFAGGKAEEMMLNIVRQLELF